MNLKNYTSTVPVGITIARIEKILCEAQVIGVSKLFDDGKISALTFHMPTQSGGQVAIRLPVDWMAVRESLFQNYCESVATPRKTRADFNEQAERTAWKLMQDWIEVQISLVHMQKIDPLQVFIAFAWDGKQTFFSRLKEGGFKQLTQGTTPIE